MQKSLLVLAILFAQSLSAVTLSPRVIANVTNSCAAVKAGTPLEVSTAFIPGAATHRGAYDVWSMVGNNPKAFPELRKDGVYLIDWLEARVEPLAKRGQKGPLPPVLSVDTTGLPVGDYTGTVEVNRKRHYFPFQIVADAAPAPTVTEKTADGVSWSLANDDLRFFFSARAPQGKDVCLFLDPQGAGTRVHRFVFKPDGRVETTLAVDDNMNHDVFVFDRTWQGDATASVRKTADGWRLQAEIPIGAMNGVSNEKSSDWGVSVGTNEKVTRAREYPRRKVSFTAKNTQAIDFPRVSVKTVKRSGVLSLVVQGGLRNGTGAYRLQRIVLVLEREDGTVLDTVERVCGLRSSGAYAVMMFDLGLGAGKIANGDRLRLRLKARTADGATACQQTRAVTVTYEPLAVRLVEPCYRDCVFATMNLRKIVGEVRAEEGLGKPLTVTLEGPGTHETFAIASLGPTNRFSFAFKNKPDGEYFIKAGRAVKRFRKLPFQKGEYWIDAKGIVRREGKPFFPYGFYSEVYRTTFPGLTVSQTYHDGIKSLEQFGGLMDQAASFGYGLIAQPHQPIDGFPAHKLFGGKAMQGDFDTPEEGPRRKAYLEKLAAYVREHDGFFCYYLADEPEGSGKSPDFLLRMHEILSEVDPYHPTMIVNFTPEGIPKFAACADIMCPDFYPVYLVGGRSIAPMSRTLEYTRTTVRCARCPMFVPQAFDWNYHAPGVTTRGPTYDELRMQMMMALSAGVKGFLLYSRVSGVSPEWDLRLGNELMAREILESQSVFLADSEPVAMTPAVNGVTAALKRAGGEALLLVINTTLKPQTIEFTAAGLPKTLYREAEKAPIAVAGGRVTLTVGAEETVIFHSRPKKFSPAAGRAEIARREAARRKPGNLAVAPHFLTQQGMVKVFKGEKQLDYPRFTTTSSKPLRPSLPGGYFLQDGFDEAFPYLHAHCWNPDDKDAAPAVTLEFGKTEKVRRVVVTRVIDEKKAFPVKRVALEIGGRVLAEKDFSSEHRAVFEIPETACDKLTVRVTKFDRAVKCGWLAEIEAY